MEGGELGLGEVDRAADRVFSVPIVYLVVSALGALSSLYPHDIRVERELNFFRIDKVRSGYAERAHGLAGSVVAQKERVDGFEYLARSSVGEGQLFLTAVGVQLVVADVKAHRTAEESVFPQAARNRRAKRVERRPDVVVRDEVAVGRVAAGYRFYQGFRGNVRYGRRIESVCERPEHLSVLSEEKKEGVERSFRKISDRFYAVSVQLFRRGSSDV